MSSNEATYANGPSYAPQKGDVVIIVDVHAADFNYDHDRHCYAGEHGGARVIGRTVRVDHVDEEVFCADFVGFGGYWVDGPSGADSGDYVYFDAVKVRKVVDLVPTRFMGDGQ